MIKIKANATQVEISDLLWGSFVEQMGRAIYGGIYDEGHPTADENGYRQDVISAVRALNLPLIRYPGGNFVSGFDWKDSVGENRPVRMNLAWQQLEPNTIGLHEFYDWCEKVGSEVMMAINLGTGTIKDALELVEYCNFGGHSTIADERRKNGKDDPFGFKYWCLGNEMDGIWQICNLPAEEYARKAREVSKLIKIIDPEIKTTLVGSSGPYIPTYPAWEKTVLEEAYDFVDYISLHLYYSVTPDGKDESFLAQYKDLERYIETVRDIVKETKERKKSNHDVYLALDEWNIWKTSNDSSDTKWLVSDVRLENVYDFRDTLLFADMVVTMTNYSDCLKIGCLAQLVNVIAPIMTENGGRMFLQPTYYPFEFACNHLKGNLLSCEYDSPVITAGEEKYQSLHVTACENQSEYAMLLVNNNLTEEFDISLEVPETARKVKICKFMKAALADVNSFDEPEKVIPKELACQKEEGAVTLRIPAASIVMLTLEKGDK